MSEKPAVQSEFKMPTMFEAHVLFLMKHPGNQTALSIAKKVMPKEVKRKYFKEYIEEAVFLVEEAQMRLSEKGFLERMEDATHSKRSCDSRRWF